MSGIFFTDAPVKISQNHKSVIARGSMKVLVPTLFKSLYKFHRHIWGKSPRFECENCSEAKIEWPPFFFTDNLALEDIFHGCVG